MDGPAEPWEKGREEFSDSADLGCKEEGEMRERRIENINDKGKENGRYPLDLDRVWMGWYG